MCNKSLDKHLYLNQNNNNDMFEFEFKTLLDIDIDVIPTLEYLHHDSSLQIVHCVIIPKIVLLDEDILCHVTYFGIARLVGATLTNSLALTLALKGSVGHIAIGMTF